MEESAKRRERLQAMRLEASCTAASQPPYYSPPAVPPPSLLQPQLDDPPVLDSPPPTRRFDFYTDPTSAFLASKRMRGVVTHAFSPSSPYGPPPPPPPSFPTVQQFRLAQPPNSSDYGVRSRVPQNNPWRSPITPSRSPASGSSSWIRSGDSTRYQYPTHSNSVHSTRYQYPTHSNSVLRSPQFDPRGSPISNTRNSSPHLSFGRGRARQFSGGRSPRPSGGRGQNYKNKASAQDDIENYFSMSMLEDPWRDMQPVVGNILEPMAGPGDWLPESMPVQRKLSEKESSGRFTSKSSLAEFLAASFEEAINDDD